MKKIFLFALMALVSAFQGWAFDFEVDGIYYTITGSGTVSVVKGTYDYDGDVTIPKTVSNGVETFNVTGIGEGAFKSCGELTSVTLPEGLTSIGNEAFYRSSIKAVSLPSTLSSMGTSAFRECKNLTGIVLPDALKHIKQYAFYNCTALKVLELGNGMEIIDANAFRTCTALESVVIPKTTKTIEASAFQDCTLLKTLKIDDAALSLGNGAFVNCAVLENVDLGNAIYNIGASTGNYYDYNGVFQNCTALKSITLPSSLKIVGFKAFMGCSKLYDVILPSTIIEIGDYAFNNCALTEIELPSSVVCIGTQAFYSNPLTQITLPSSLQTIGQEAFNKCKISALTIPATVSTIGAGAFYNNQSLNSIKIDNAAVTINGNAFANCTALRNVDLGNKVAAFENNEGGAFQGCTSLEQIKLPNTLKSLQQHMFHDCTNLKKVELPNSLTNIDASAFYNCKKLEIVDIPSTVQTIGNGSFYYCNSLKEINFPMTLKTIGDNAFENTGLYNLLIPENVTTIGNSAYRNCTNLKELVIDNAILEIGESAFAGCHNLESLDLGKATLIKKGAFSDCVKLTNVVIPNSVTKFTGPDPWNSGVFAGCTSLEKVIIGTGLETFGDGYSRAACFEGCIKLTTVIINGNSLVTVSSNTFKNCRSLRKIELPASVTSIGETAFEGCSVLSHIYMNATTPPSIRDNTFSDYNTPTLHVPAEAKTAYTKADNWKNFTNVIAIGSEPKATAEEIATLDALLTEATALYNGSVEGTEPGNYRPGAKAALKAVIDEVEARFNDNMLAEDVEDCMEMLNTAIKSFKNKQVKNDIQTNNTLAFAETLKAATGSEFRLPIEMNNTDEITGVQFDLYLPEGMQLSQDEYGDYNIELSERTTARRHSVASRVMPDGALRVVVSSQQNATFSGNSGTLLTLVLFPASTLEAGDYDVELKNVILTDPNANRYAAPDIKSVITVSTYTLGDVNNDGFIDVADLAGVVRFILENADATLIFNAADMDGNGVVEINDYAALVNVILAQDAPQSSSLRKANAIRNTVISLSDLCLNSNGEGELMVRLDFNDMRYTGLQFDLNLPNGIELMDEGAEAMSRQHGAWAQKHANGTYRVICSSMVNDELREGDVLRLQVKVTGELNGTLDAEATNVVLSDVNAVRHEAASAKATLTTDDATSISELRSNESVNVIFNLAGQRLNKMQRGINIVNGKKNVVK